MCIDLLDEDGFVLQHTTEVSLVAPLVKSDADSRGGRAFTWTFAVQSEVILLILDPDTPGGLRASIDWRKPSSSATAEDMVMCIIGGWKAQFQYGEQRKKGWPKDCLIIASDHERAQRGLRIPGTRSFLPGDPVLCGERILRSVLKRVKYQRIRVSWPPTRVRVMS